MFRSNQAGIARTTACGMPSVSATGLFVATATEASVPPVHSAYLKSLRQQRYFSLPDIVV
jgi:hypothetical protein